MTENQLVVLVIVGGTLLTIAIVLVARQRAAKRRMALESIALQSGWSFAPDKVGPQELGAGPLPLFSHGHSKRATNVMRGSDGTTAIAVFDYRYTIGAGKNQHTYAQTVVHLKSPRLSLPPFALAPENLLHKVGGLFGYHDIDFDSNPEFSTKYLLRSKEHEGRVRDLFSPSLRVYFEQRTPIHVQGDGDEVVVYTERRIVKPDDLRTFVEDALSVVRHFGA